MTREPSIPNSPIPQSPISAWSRRATLAALAGAGLSLAARPLAADAPKKTLVAVTFDLEMSANFPNREDTFWNFEKGNLNQETKDCSLEAARRMKAAGGVLHCFSVARVCEQENVDWLKKLAAEGHPIGNHTYDHVFVLAKKPEEVQFRFARSPWLLEGMEAAEAIRQNIRLANVALKQRVGVDAAGFRTPGGFGDGLTGREDVQRMLLDLGFKWVSSKYPLHQGAPQSEPTEEFYQELLSLQEKAQPFVYPTGLIEVPMNPISDIGAFRVGRWKLEWFLTAIERAFRHCVEHGYAFDFLGHPSCLYVTDPEFKTIDLLLRLAKEYGERVQLVDCDALAKLAKAYALCPRDGRGKECGRLSWIAVTQPHRGETIIAPGVSLGLADERTTKSR